MKISEMTKDLKKFLDESPVGLYAAANIRGMLLENGYTECQEGSEWKLVLGGRYFVMRNGSAVIAFQIPKEEIHAAVKAGWKELSDTRIEIEKKGESSGFSDLSD